MSFSTALFEGNLWETVRRPRSVPVSLALIPYCMGKTTELDTTHLQKLITLEEAQRIVLGS